ncbi:MAG: hypothetical protein U1E30_05090 [Rhodoblastus sp.]
MLLAGESAAGRALRPASSRANACASSPARLCRKGADAILIQEDAIADGFVIGARELIREACIFVAPAWIFATAKLAFKAGARPWPCGTLALAAAMNHPTAPVTRRPRVAILATGDELPPGQTPLPIRSSAPILFAVAAYMSKALAAG